MCAKATLAAAVLMLLKSCGSVNDSPISAAVWARHTRLTGQKANSIRLLLKWSHDVRPGHNRCSQVLCMDNNM